MDYSSFSKSGLIDHLEFKGFSTEDSTWAVEKLEKDGSVDWNAQAVGKAKDYLNYSSFSRSGLIEQLEFEGFTADQAEYAADQVGY